MLKDKIYIVFITTLLFSCFNLAADEGKDHGTEGTQPINQMPYAEGSTKNFEIVINYNDVLPNKETKLILYISDFSTNAPVENAAVNLEITGIDNSKIQAPVSTSAGVYEFVVEFPEIKKYDFLISVKAGDVEDLIPMNEIDISLKEELKTDNADVEKSFIDKIHDNLFLIIIFAVAIILIAVIFYRIGAAKNRKKSPSKTEII